jgi:hypothetical protein
MFAPLGALAALLLGGRWGAKRSALLIAIGVALPAILLWRLNQGMSGFSLFRSMSSHRLVNVLLLLAQPLVDGGKFSPLILPPRLLMLLLAPAAAVLLRGESRGRSYLLAWGAIGVFEMAPALVALVKEGGNFNNLGAIDLWLFLLVLPAALRAHERISVAGAAPLSAKRRGDGGEVAADLAPAARVLAAMILLGLTLGLYPLKQTIRSNAWEFCRLVEQRVRADLADGKRVWVPTGAEFLIRAGRTAPIEDLSINIWTAEKSGERGLQIYQRLASRCYDRIYLIFPWELAVRDDIDKEYRKVDRILGPDYGGHKDHRGVQPYLTIGCDIYEPKPAGAPEQAAPPPSAVETGMQQAAPLQAGGETNH